MKNLSYSYNEDDVKAFIRILKEVGVYKIWQINRKKFTYNRDKPLACSTFSGLLQESFISHFTKEHQLWRKLVLYSPPGKCTEIFKDQMAIDKIKSICKEYIGTIKR